MGRKLREKKGRERKGRNVLECIFINKDDALAPGDRFPRTYTHSIVAIKLIYE